MKSNNFIKRSIAGILIFLKDSVFAEEAAQRLGFLQSLNPPVKAAGFLLLILQALLTSSLGVLFFLYAWVLFFAIISKINLGFFLKRTWVFIPLFSLCIAIPAIFGPGEPLYSWQILGVKFSITRQGLAGSLIFVARVITCVSLAILLNISTRHFDLLKVLRIFKIPQIFVTTLGMCYRYVYLFVGIIQDMYLAIKSRVGSPLKAQSGQRVVAWNIASFWNYSVSLNEETYKAMLSRGYQGEALVWGDYKIRLRDGMWLLLVALIIWII